MGKQSILGHILALITIIIWGTTFVSTKILLKVFSPEEILFYRFLMAFLFMLAIYPKNYGRLDLKEEVLLAVLGLTGITLYFWTENIALQYTLASNVGLILSSIPIFTAILAHFVTKDEKFSLNLILGFVLAMLGIFIIIYNGQRVKLNPLGDILALTSAILFSVYSILTKKINQEYSQLYVVKKIFFYGLLFSLPLLLVSDIKLEKVFNLTWEIVANLLFLAICASVLCFIMWNKAVAIIGAVKTTNYIYLVPLITMLSSIIFLKEKVSWLMFLGGGLIFMGVYLNESKLISPREGLRDKTINN